MSKEKEVISKLREIIDYDKKHRLETIFDKEQIEFRNNIELVLDLVDKLERENYFFKQEQAKRNWIRVKEDGEVVPLLYISKDKIRELLEEHNIEFGKETISMSEQGAFGFMLSIKELLEEE